MAAQTGVHTLLTQDVVPFALVHLLPQDEQLFTSLVVLASQPLAVLLSQLPKPVLQPLNVHALATQLATPLVKLQALPQLAQLVVVPSCVSQPLITFPSQLLYPGSQLGTHRPLVQVVLPWALLHTVPQAPQFALLVVTLVSQPSE